MASAIPQRLKQIFLQDDSSGKQTRLWYRLTFKGKILDERSIHKSRYLIIDKVEMVLELLNYPQLLIILQIT